jgi:hypothetical protein
MLSLSLLLACTGEPDIDSGKSEDSGTTDTDTGTGGDGVSPVVTTASSDCSINTDDQAIWFITAMVTDPQGTDTLSLGSVEEWQKDPTLGGEPLDTHAIVCTGDGTCTTSWEDNTGLGTCDLEGKLWFRVIAVDEDDHSSAAYDFQSSAS